MTCRFLSLLMGAWCALALMACAPAIAPPPDEAAVSVPARWQARTSVASAEASAVRPLWWREVQDPVLNNLVDAALDHNVDLQLAITRIAQARGEERIARSAMSPHLSTSALGGRTEAKLDMAGVPNVLNVGVPMLTAGYELDLFGLTAQRVEAARNLVLSAEYARDAAALSLTASVTSGYFTLRALDARLAVLRATVVARETSVQLAVARRRAGYSSQLEPDQARAELESTRQQIPLVELAIARQEHALSLLTGRPPQAIVRGKPLSELVLPLVSSEQPSAMLRRRPDVAQAESVLAASDAQLAAARAEFMPKISLTAQLGWLFASPLDSPARLWTLGGSVLAPLFSGGQLEGGFDVATAARNGAALSYKKVVLQAFKDVEDALVAHERNQAHAQALAAQRAAVADTLKHATARYRSGYSPYLEQVDAERALLSVELAMVQARLDQLQAQVALHQALGGGWERPASAPLS